MVLPVYQSSVIRCVRHSADDMFALVADVESYPQFVPLCDSLVILDRQATDDGNEVLLCEMSIRYGMNSQTFKSNVRLQRRERNILVENVSGPFATLENRWFFSPLDEGGGCEVNFFIAYSFSSVLVQFLAGGVIERAFDSFVDAFENRADIVYGIRF